MPNTHEVLFRTLDDKKAGLLERLCRQGEAEVGALKDAVRVLATKDGSKHLAALPAGRAGAATAKKGRQPNYRRKLGALAPLVEDRKKRGRVMAKPVFDDLEASDEKDGTKEPMPDRNACRLHRRKRDCASTRKTRRALTQPH